MKKTIMLLFLLLMVVGCEDFNGEQPSDLQSAVAINRMVAPVVVVGIDSYSGAWGNWCYVSVRDGRGVIHRLQDRALNGVTPGDTIKFITEAN